MDILHPRHKHNFLRPWYPAECFKRMNDNGLSVQSQVLLALPGAHPRSPATMTAPKLLIKHQTPVSPNTP